VKSLVRDRLLGIFFSQSFDIIDRGIGSKADLNFGCQVALGFRKGPLDVMSQLGDKEVKRVMAQFKKNRPGFPKASKSLAAYLDFKRHVLVDDIDGVKVITIRRPQAMNALSDEVTDEILSVLQEYADDPAVEGFVITGYGTQAFSAGADIGKFPSMLGDAKASAQYARDCAKVQVFMDEMDKPVVAALNGMALGGGLEVAIRCHRLLALPQAMLGFPEITLGILPGIGGCVVPYRKWPQGAELFNEMICLGRIISAKQAQEVGMIAGLADDYPSLIQAALAEVKKMAGAIPRMEKGPVEIPAIDLPDPPLSGKQPLSREAVAIVAETVKAGAAAPDLASALEIGYQGFGKIACIDAAREGISAFLEKRRPVFDK
jgi:enoyl-CoA hydratase/3-hydroxyacyl-CoA dehydrogenase